jgi:ribose transport system permease protein
LSEVVRPPPSVGIGKKRQPARRAGHRMNPDHLQLALPFIALVVMLVVIFAIRPAAFSYFGFGLLFNLAVPLILASMAQMLVICLGDIDLSVGNFVGFVTCVVAVFLRDKPFIAMLLLAAGIVAYAAVGVLIQLRSLPSIIVTLGMSFVWLGLALLILPSPGGTAPDWLTATMALQTPWIPLPLVIAVALAAAGHWLLKRSAYGVVLLGAGANPRAAARAGWSLLQARIMMYGTAGGLAVLSGLALSGLTTSGDPNIAPTYTLLGVGAVILGGGSFTGGLVSPVGTMVGAMTLSLAGSLLSFLNVPPVWQVGAQGVILFLVLAGRVFIGRSGR